MELAREWAAFAGSLFALMGAALAFDARSKADDALSWERQWRAAVGAAALPGDDAPRRRKLTLAYRAGGALFLALGAALLVSAATGRGPFVAREVGREPLLGGVFFTACGAVLAVNGWLRRGRRGPRFLEGELLADDAPASLGERVSTACARATIVLFLAFGVRLLLRAARG